MKMVEIKQVYTRLKNVELGLVRTSTEKGRNRSGLNLYYEKAWKKDLFPVVHFSYYIHCYINDITP